VNIERDVHIGSRPLHQELHIDREVDEVGEEVIRKEEGNQEAALVKGVNL